MIRRRSGAFVLSNGALVGGLYDHVDGSYDATWHPEGGRYVDFARRVPTSDEAVRLLHVHLLMNDPRYDGSLERDYPELFAESAS